MTGRFARLGIVWVCAGLFVTLALTTDRFLSAANIRNVLDQQSAIMIGAAAATLTMIAGGVDLSQAALFVTSPILALWVENETESILLGVGAAVLFGVLVGVLNGGLSLVGRVESFVVTLAMSFVVLGIGFFASDRSVLRPINADAWAAIARSRWLGLTSATWIAFAIVLVCGVVLHATAIGRWIYATGSNAEAARLAGVSTTRVMLGVFAASAAGAAVAGTLTASRTVSAQASDDFGFTLDVVAAIVVGGTSIAGGRGAIWRTVVGGLVIALMVNGFNLHQIDPLWQRIFQGALILGAVGVDSYSRRERSVRSAVTEG